MLDDFYAAAKIYADTYHIVKAIVPRSDPVENYRLHSLVKAFTSMAHTAHDGLSDAQATQELFNARLQKADLSRYLISTLYPKSMRSFSRLVNRQEITLICSQRLSRFGVSMRSIRRAHDSDSESGILQHLSQLDNSGRTLVDDVENLANYFKRLIETEHERALNDENTPQVAEQKQDDSVTETFETISSDEAAVATESSTSVETTDVSTQEINGEEYNTTTTEEEKVFPVNSVNVLKSIARKDDSAEVLKEVGPF